jgi:hypothetical protein
MKAFASRFGMLTERYGTPCIVTTPQAAFGQATVSSSSTAL